MPERAAEPDWEGYYATVRVREPRDTLAAALAAFAAGDAGDGGGPPAAGDAGGPPAAGGTDGGGTAPAAGVRHAVDLGCGDGTDTLALLAAGWSVTAVDAFDALWQQIRAAVRPGGRIACHLLGPHDTWAVAAAPGVSWHGREQVDALLAGLVVERLEETDEDGWSYAGDKHWHLWRILARVP